ncbi:FAD-binding oxidoreductase, partial [Streptomyces sp. SID4931]|nr:FAD-binding oxidoreductase [Streptomyces sp. SID4931]
VKSATMIDDVCVPRSQLGAMLAGTAAIAEEYDLTIGVCAHAGDGNTHPSSASTTRTPTTSRRARESFDAIMALGLELGGTITGEHGVGVLKKEWLARELGETGVELQRSIKAAFDPLGLLNPGKLF